MEKETQFIVYALAASSLLPTHQHTSFTLWCREFMQNPGDSLQYMEVVPFVSEMQKCVQHGKTLAEILELFECEVARMHLGKPSIMESLEIELKNMTAVNEEMTDREAAAREDLENLKELFKIVIEQRESNWNKFVQRGEQINEVLAENKRLNKSNENLLDRINAASERWDKLSMIWNETKREDLTNAQTMEHFKVFYQMIDDWCGCKI